MKKNLSLFMVVIVFLSALFFGTGKARAAGTIRYAGGHFVIGKGISFVFNASGYRNRDVRGASIFAGSNFHNLYCSVNKEEGKIICVAGGQLTDYAGQTAVIHLAGQIFYVTMPYQGEGHGLTVEEEPSVDEEPAVEGDPAGEEL